jgi:hypothetical protein
LTQSSSPTLTDIATRINRLKRDGVRIIVEIGQLLTKAQEIAGNRPAFLKWLKEEVGYSEETARRWMAVAERPDLAKLDLKPSVAYLLAGAPEQAAEEVAGLLEKGRSVTVQQTYEIASKHALTAIVERGVEDVRRERHPDRAASIALGVLNDLAEATANPALRETAVGLLKRHGDFLTGKAEVQGSADGVLSDLGVGPKERYPVARTGNGITLTLYDHTPVVEIVAWIDQQPYQVLTMTRNGNAAVRAIQDGIVGMLGHTYGLRIEPKGAEEL